MSETAETSVRESRSPESGSLPARRESTPLHQPRSLPGVDWDEDRTGPGFFGGIAEALHGHQRKLLHTLLLTLFAWMGIEWYRVVTARPQPPALQRGDQFRQQFCIDINSAGWVDWMQLDGIGPALAHRIVADREEHGEFTSIDDLRRVTGIGPAKLESMRPWLRMGHDSADTSQPSSRSGTAVGRPVLTGNQQPAAL